MFQTGFVLFHLKHWADARTAMNRSPDSQGSDACGASIYADLARRAACQRLHPEFLASAWVFNILTCWRMVVFPMVHGALLSSCVITRLLAQSRKQQK